MDLSCFGLVSVSLTNLRSRGDGPFIPSLVLASSVKPPLTRRWTVFLFRDCQYYVQTSAHAEMDPHVALYEIPVKPNLRSRGDGPIPAALRFRYVCKPPLTRRWTHR